MEAARLNSIGCWSPRHHHQCIWVRFNPGPRPGERSGRHSLGQRFRPLLPRDLELWKSVAYGRSTWTAEFRSGLQLPPGEPNTGAAIVSGWQLGVSFFGSPVDTSPPSDFRFWTVSEMDGVSESAALRKGSVLNSPVGNDGVRSQPGQAAIAELRQSHTRPSRCTRCPATRCTIGQRRQLVRTATSAAQNVFWDLKQMVLRGQK